MPKQSAVKDHPLRFVPLYIHPQGLHNLKDYRYSCVDKSLVANHVMQPFWRQVIELVPMWMAPNVVTLLGFFFVVLSFCVSVYYNPSMTEAMPMWVYLLNAVCLFLYQTLDALDGKQARRTQSSSALGELFDHGCDAMTSVFSTLTVYATLRFGLGWFPLLHLLVAMATFYVAQWEVYFTGTLHLWYINVTEAQFMGMAVHMMPLLFGIDWWVSPINLFGYEIAHNYFLLPGSTAAVVILLLLSLQNIYNLYQKKPKNFEKAPAFLYPAVWILVSSFVWAFLTTDIWLHDHNLSLAFHISFGFIFANAISKLCTARVCKVDYDTNQFIFILPIIGVALALVPGLENATSLMIYVSAVVSVVSYGTFSVALIHDMTHFLEINAFKIPILKQH